MKTVFIACRLLWKRKLANLALILQVLFSVITLAQLFVFVADHVDSVRAVGELPYENAVAMAVYDYCDPEQTRRQVLSSPQVAGRRRGLSGRAVVQRRLLQPRRL